VSAAGVGTSADAAGMSACATRHRVLIAAAVAAAVGSARILDIRPAAWTRRRAAGVLGSRGPSSELSRRIGAGRRRSNRGGGVVKLLITLESKRYEVDVEILPDASAEPSNGEYRLAIPDSVLLPPLLPDIRESDKICRSPIAGAIVSVEVAVGMRVRQDDPIATIDAMKVETVVGAPVDGLVEEVEVRPGDAVKTGQVLCRLS